MTGKHRKPDHVSLAQALKINGITDRESEAARKIEEDLDWKGGPVGNEGRKSSPQGWGSNRD